MIQTIIAVGICAIIIWKMVRSYKKRVGDLEKELKETKFELRSNRVKFGKSFEHFVPFTKDFPGDKNNTTFLGMPIDFISFDEDSIKFIEVKTGSSNLNKNQKRIKEQVQNKKIEWCEIRY